MESWRYSKITEAGSITRHLFNAHYNRSDFRQLLNFFGFVSVGVRFADFNLGQTTRDGREWRLFKEY